MKRLMAVALSVVALNANADILDKLADTPASKLEVGKLGLDIISYVSTEQLQGNRIEVEGDKFEYKKVTALSDPNKIGLVISLEGKTRDLSEQKCALAPQLAAFTFNRDRLVRNVFPGLSERNYAELSKEFFLNVEFISRENDEIKIACN